MNKSLFQAQPIIGVSIDLRTESKARKEEYFLCTHYTQALEKAGAIPVLFSYAEATIDALLPFCDGILITGGGFTIDPAFFNQKNTSSLPLNSKRTQFELSLFHKAYALSIPILGICGGAQLINVALGGTLIQKLPSSNISHIDNPYQATHSLQLVQNTLLCTICKGAETIRTNTSHQQAIDQLGKNVLINAIAEDKITEGIELKNYPFCLGLQWHPEYFSAIPYDYHIFSSFINFAKTYRQACLKKILFVRKYLQEI